MHSMVAVKLAIDKDSHPSKLSLDDNDQIIVHNDVVQERKRLEDEIAQSIVIQHGYEDGAGWYNFPIFIPNDGAQDDAKNDAKETSSTGGQSFIGTCMMAFVCSFF